MPSAHVNVSAPIKRTARVMQIEGTFDMPAVNRGTHERVHELPIEAKSWTIGMIAGPSGSGKSQLLSALYRGKLDPPEWPTGRAIVDAFPKTLGIRDITEALSSVGLSSPPAWVRPFETLSNGERFRADLARRMLDHEGDVVVVDEFTSVVDRTVAQIASAAVAKYARRVGQQLVVAACHYDVIDWLQPDWLYDTGTMTFEWRSLQRRPPIAVDIERCTRAHWQAFAPHHYLSADLSNASKCFLATVGGRPAVFVAALLFPHFKVGADAAPIWRDHRTVTLPDFQGVGIGNAVNERIAAVFTAAGFRWRSTTAHPGMIAHRARSTLWDMDRRPGFVRATSDRGRFSASLSRRTASFEYVGPPADRVDVELLIPELLDRQLASRQLRRRTR